MCVACWASQLSADSASAFISLNIYKQQPCADIVLLLFTFKAEFSGKENWGGLLSVWRYSFLNVRLLLSFHLALFPSWQMSRTGISYFQIACSDKRDTARGKKRSQRVSKVTEPLESQGPPLMWLPALSLPNRRSMQSTNAAVTCKVCNMHNAKA